MRPQTNNLNNWQKLRTLMGYCIVGVLIIYAFFHFRIWWQGPQISITAPYPGSESVSSIIRVRGVADNLARVYINGLLIPISLRENSFVADIALPEGYSTIGITGYTQSGRQISQNIPIVYRNKPILDPSLQFLAPSDLGILTSAGSNLAFQ